MHEPENPPSRESSVPPPPRAGFEERAAEERPLGHGQVIDVPAISSTPAGAAVPPVPPAAPASAPPPVPPATPATPPLAGAAGSIPLPPEPPPPPRPPRAPEPRPSEPLPPPPGPPPGVPLGAPPYSGPQHSGPGQPAPRGTGWPMAAHLTSLIGLGFACFLVNFVGPLIVWLTRKDEDPETDWHGRESLNFQLNLLLYWLAALPLWCCVIGIFIHLLLPVYAIVMVVYASVQAADGKRWRYPWTLRLLAD